MAYAMVCGMGDADITVYDKIVTQYDKFAPSVKRAASAAEAVASADYVILSVKPQNFKELLTEIKQSGTSVTGKVFISIAAGVKISSICAALGREVAVIRTMPNTPLLIGKGVTALSRNGLVSDAAFEEIKGVFSAIGSVLTLDEDKMNAVIAATSSAPAYVYYFIDCMVKEAEAQGLDASVMLKAVCDMVKGSADMVLESGRSPEELVKMVTSPNGTTERAMKVFKENGFEKTVSDAMKACTARAEELSAELD